MYFYSHSNPLKYNFAFISHLLISVSVQGEAYEEEAPAGENGDHNIKDKSEQTAEEDARKDDFTQTEIETNDGSSDSTRKIEVPNHRVLVFNYVHLKHTM